MSTVATAPSTAPPLPADAPTPDALPGELYRFNVEQYEGMVEAGILTTDDRVELIDGHVVTRMSKKPSHVWALDSVEPLLRGVLGVAWCLRREGPVQMPPSDEPEPDIVVARGTRLTYLGRHPAAAEIVLVVEVSDTSYHRDRGKKWDANARSGIPVYWIVNLPKRQIEVYTDPSPEGYQTRRDYRAGEVIPVVIDGQTLGQIAVDDILPPPTDEDADA